MIFFVSMILKIFFCECNIYFILIATRCHLMSLFKTDKDHGDIRNHYAQQFTYSHFAFNTMLLYQRMHVYLQNKNVEKMFERLQT